MAFQSKTQPLCRTCGKPIKKLARTVYVDRPGNTATAGATALSRHIQPRRSLLSREDCIPFTNGQILAVSYHYEYDHATGNHDRKAVRWFTEWDGESYEDEFFHTGKCAQLFGYFAAKNNAITSKKYAEAVAKIAPAKAGAR